MAELLGVVAAAAQLATYAMALGNIALSIKSSKSIISEHRQYLGDLRLIADCIGRNPVLQTSEVEQLTKSIIATVDASPVREVLFKASKYRFVRAVRTVAVVLYQKQIQDLLRSVEQQKSTLSISIAQIQTLQLLEIKSTIQTMSSRIQPHCKEALSDEFFLRESQAQYDGSIVLNRKEHFDQGESESDGEHSDQGESESGGEHFAEGESESDGESPAESESESDGQSSAEGRSGYDEKQVVLGGSGHVNMAIAQSTAVFRGNTHSGNAEMHLGPDISGRFEGSLMACTSNVVYTENVKEKERPTRNAGNKKPSRSVMTLGPKFSGGAVAERYGGAWIENTQKADAPMTLGAVIKGKEY